MDVFAAQSSKYIACYGEADFIISVVINIIIFTFILIIFPFTGRSYTKLFPLGSVSESMTKCSIGLIYTSASNIFLSIFAVPFIMLFFATTQFL